MIVIAHTRFLLAAAGLSLAACDDEPPMTPDVPILTPIEEDRLLLSASRGDEAAYENLMTHFLGTSQFEGAHNLALNWSSNDPKRAAEHLCDLRDTYQVELAPLAADITRGRC